MRMSRRDAIKGAGIAIASASLGMFAPRSGAEDSCYDVNTETTRFDLRDHGILSQSDGCYVEDPVVASNGLGAAWAVWLKRCGHDKDMIMFSEHQGKWSEARQVTLKEGMYESPRISCSPDGQPMLVWVEIRGDKWFLNSSKYEDGTFGPPKPVSSSPGRAWSPVLVPEDQRGFYLAWESYQDGVFRICVSRYRNGKWRRPVDLTNGETNAYDPACALDATGNLWVSFSAIREGERKIVLAQYDAQRRVLGTSWDIALGDGSRDIPCLDAYPALWCDGENRVWVAYESGGDNLYSNHGSRVCRVVCLDKGRLCEVDPQAEGFGGRTPIQGENDHYPALLADGHGRPWLFSRTSVAEGRSWNLKASCLQGSDGWTPPISLLDPEYLGRLSRPSVAVSTGSTFWIAWQEDDYFRGKRHVEHRLSSQINIARIHMRLPEVESGTSASLLKASESGAAVPIHHSTPVALGLERPADVMEMLQGKRDDEEIRSVTPGIRVRPPSARRTVEANGEKYTLLLGNLHEHTLVSRCAAGCHDGTFEDNYRYGMNVEGYDFMGMTDHGYDLDEAAWQKTRRMAEFYNDPTHFIALPGYEWTLIGHYKIIPSCGHRNIFFGSDADAARWLLDNRDGRGVPTAYSEESDRMDKVWQLLRDKGITDAVTIPHHPADNYHPMDWDYHDPEYQSVVEIFQCRQSAEHKGCPRQTKDPYPEKDGYVQDALARGHKMGFVASGDHNSMGQGLAAVLVKEVSQKGIIEALKARRCYATTGDKIYVDFRVDGHIMGEECRATGKPRITARVECTLPAQNLVVFKNNQVIYEKTEADLGNTGEVLVDFTDEEFTESSYYYLRMVQVNNEIAWSSPVWVEREAGQS